jgi:hypothetical protein
MDLDETIALAKELISKRESIDRQLADLFAGTPPVKKARRCKICDGEGHNASTCPNRKEQSSAT